MKIWEKIYLVVIALFLLVLNTCNILIFRSSYEKSVDLVKQAAESSWKYMAISMTEDLSEIENERTAEWQLFQSYVSNYCTRQCAFELWRGQELRERSGIADQITYSSSEGTLGSEFWADKKEQEEVLGLEEGKGKITILEREGEKYSCTAGRLGTTGYQLVIYENVSEALRVWESQMITFVWMEMAASLLMAVLLYHIIRRFLEPVSRISKITGKIAAGDYTCHLEVKGNDELSGLARDINHMTEQVRETVEYKEAQARQKQEFIYALSHEMRTPLTSVRGYAELVRNTDVSPEKRLEYMDYIVRESGRMVEITETLRQVMLLRQEEMETEEIPLGDLAGWLQQMADRQLAGKDIVWKFEAGEGAVTGNRILVEIFFLNLLRNSYHACRADGMISLCLGEKKAVIEDNGTGMTKECLEHIYEPFYREDKSRSRRLGGSGLGMYLCHYIADRHNWEMKIGSEKGVGTIIEVYFTTI